MLGDHVDMVLHETGSGFVDDGAKVDLGNFQVYANLFLVIGDYFNRSVLNYQHRRLQCGRIHEELF
jgi:hypothetical protein